MNLNAVDKLSVRLYRDGTGVLYFTQYRKDNHVNPVQKAERKFGIKKTHVRSACLACWGRKKSKNMLFITFTFPYEPSEIEAKKIWKLLLDSLRNTYNIKNYVWVKERQKTGRLHYHVIVDSDRIGISKLQSTWNNHINNVNPRCAVSNNSVRLGNNPVIRTVKAVSCYLSKYISKDVGEKYTQRAWGTSIEKESFYKEIDIGEILHSCYEQKNSGETHYLLRENIRILLDSDCFMVFKMRDYFDISP